MSCLLISTLAEYQTSFWAKVGNELRQRGLACEFISFDDRSTEMLRSQGFIVYSRQDLTTAPKSLLVEDAIKLLTKYGISTPERWFLHERFAYGEQNPNILLRKLCASLQLAEMAIVKCKATHGEVSLIQEVGGFLSVIGCFFAAQHNKITNWFIEPSFFKGRLFFTKDSLAAPQINNNHSTESLLEVQNYLKNALETKRIVIPEKDRHHYSPALKKILNQHNLVRLFQKSVDKYLLGKKQEFGYIGKQLATHIKMLVNSYLLKNSYTPLADIGRFIYFPLHVPGDMALTIRSPEYVDQLSLLEHILRATPLTHKVAVKEHPAMIGALDAMRFRKLLRRYPQFKIIRPSTSNYDVICASELVVSINSKSGAEALLLGKKVAVSGEAFYSQCSMVNCIDSPRQLAKAIPELLATDVALEKEKLIDYFNAIWNSSLEGELYVSGKESVARFTDSLVKVVVSA